jgi:patatin-like phospholipase/acyl hydrolase
MNQLVKILAIDGGGIRGMIPAMLLAHIENITRRPIATLFDLVAGTSTGGILALGLTIPKTAAAPLYTAQHFVDMYEHEGSRIFSRSFWRRIVACGNLREEKYSTAGIEAVLADYFGDARLRDAVTDVLVTSYEIERSFPFFFKSSNARERMDYDFPARLVARSTSAAPTYFEPMKLPAGTNTDHYTLIDGGVFANNPAACALVEARTTHPEADDFLVVSLGTGALNHNLSWHNQDVGRRQMGCASAQHRIRRRQQYGGLPASPTPSRWSRRVPAILSFPNYAGRSQSCARQRQPRQYHGAQRSGHRPYRKGIWQPRKALQETCGVITSLSQTA